MFFLLRMTFWLGLVLILLPSGSSQQLPASEVGASEAISAASATVGDLRQFCTRQPDACTVGSQVATARLQGAGRRQDALRFPDRDAGAQGRPARSRTAQRHRKPRRRRSTPRRTHSRLPIWCRHGTGRSRAKTQNTRPRFSNQTEGRSPATTSYIQGRRRTNRPMADIAEIIDNFSVLDDWDDRYRYLIELGRELPPLADRGHNDANKVQGCASQVWLDTTVRPNGAGGPILALRGRQRCAHCARPDRHPVRDLFR